MFHFCQSFSCFDILPHSFQSSISGFPYSLATENDSHFQKPKMKRKGLLGNMSIFMCTSIKYGVQYLVAYVSLSIPGLLCFRCLEII